jgi:hypothetical protein
MKTTQWLAVLFLSAAACATSPAPQGPSAVPLFNGSDLSGWRVPEGDNGHWKVRDGVIDYDARSEAPGEMKDLWTEREYGDFVLELEWRIKETPSTYPIPTVLPDGSHQRDPSGKEILTALPNADSGVYLRGDIKAQVNIWCWPVGSGEVYGYRTDEKMPAVVRAGVTPKVRADNPVGEWNRFRITMRGRRLTVVLNGKPVITDAQLPGVPSRGPIGFQHHGKFKDGKYDGAPALVQFRNITIQELGQ